MLLKASEDKLGVAQEELAANRTHQTGLEDQIQELKTGRGSLEQELTKLDQKRHQQEQTLKELQKQQVSQKQIDTHTHLTLCDEVNKF